MLRSIPPPACDPRLARFACVSLVNADRGFARANLLATVGDAGPTHFDVAPFYGFGMAEPGLTPLLKARPMLKVAGKAGLFAPAGEPGSAFAILSRKTAAKLAPALPRAQVDFSLARREKETLPGNLWRLGGDRLNLFFRRAQAHIRAFGVSAARPRQPRLAIADTPNQSHRRNPGGALVVSTRRVERRLTFAAAAESEGQCHAQAI